MIAFISYSLNESEKYVLTLLAQKLQERGFSLTSGYGQSLGFVDFQTENEIKNSSLFIGVITSSGRYNSTKVYLELQVAQKYNKPIILLVEDTVPLDFGIANFPNLIKFNRYYPHLALNEVKNRIQFSKSDQQDNSLAWILGGAAALALIAYLSSEKK
jgi:hypothetical protein